MCHQRRGESAAWRYLFSPVNAPLERMTLPAKLLSGDDEQNAFATTGWIR